MMVFQVSTATSCGCLKATSQISKTTTAGTVLDLRGFSLGAGANLRFAFAANKSLTTILVDTDWVLPTLGNGYQAFCNCTSLVGGNGTAYASSDAGGSYMVIDAEGSAGYLTADRPFLSHRGMEKSLDK